MEELSQELKFRVVNVQPQRKSLYKNGKSENMQWNRAHQNLTTSNRPSFAFKQSSEIPDSPTDAMEFLCRSWSPSASDFLHTLPSSDLLLQLNDCGKIQVHEEKEDGYKVTETMVQRRAAMKTDNTSWVDMNQMIGWLKGHSLTSFLRSRRERKREEHRFLTAKLHVALSVTRLAAAIANFATHGGVACDQNMGTAVASAAALVTTVWAETAESLGAHRVEVASAINAGLAIQTPMDMMALTATAATCLRGAATLESRAMAESYFPRCQEMLKVGAQICIILPSGRRKCKWVSVTPKQKELMLSFKKKYLGGTLTISKEYKVISIVKESNEAQGYFFLSLKTNNGNVKLLLEDKKQFTIWFSTISNLLETPSLL